MMSKQRQQSGNDSINYQVSGDMIVQGLTREEAKDVALEVFRANFPELVGVAKKVADERVEKLLFQLLGRLFRENPQGASQFKDPDFLYVLYGAQRDYARSGDGDLGDLLTEMLVERSSESRDLSKLVLNEAITVVPKLTKDQLAAVAVYLLISNFYPDNIRNLKQLGQYFEEYVWPFAVEMKNDEMCDRHLQSVGCILSGVFGDQMFPSFVSSYNGLFQKGFYEEYAAKHGVDVEACKDLFVKCEHGKDKLQFATLGIGRLKMKLAAQGIESGEVAKFTALYESQLMDEQTIRTICSKISPHFEQLFALSAHTSQLLTTVGLAIGQAVIRTKAKDFPSVLDELNY